MTHKALLVIDVQESFRAHPTWSTISNPNIAQDIHALIAYERGHDRPRHSVARFEDQMGNQGRDDDRRYCHLSTGAPTIVLVMTALVSVPMQNASAKLEGYIDFIKALPVPRALFLIADVSIWAVVTIPAIVISTLIAHLIFEPGYAVSWTIVPAFVLAVLASFGVGYGYSFVLPAEAAMAVSQVIAFTSLMFTPISFPIERLPEWLQMFHQLFPVYHIAEVMRASLASNTFQAQPLSYIVLAIWALLGFVGAIRFLERA